ncbi:DUF6843 domain-containing protein [Paenibacillus qinlingensis]|uniref:DUF6843 domain-containing protein n=1 Tax=Paenibacillus qinlingensis TaxID=1837343 RepID=A0ABU1NTG8_9BACL|nr:hypothetical protein [Paenibacillus qinlingensis]MDR6550781.1 hypothetical protein [Paenibacillus qinlingensis]
MNKYICIGLTFMVLGFLGLIIFITTINNNPHHIYLLPENFVGEVQVTFDQLDYPPLPKEENAFIYTIPKSGKLKTSNTMESGGVEVNYVDNQGQRKKVSHEQFHGVSSHGGGEDNLTVARTFIGTKEQYDDYLKQQ